jgi:hypothetical protein
MRYFEIKLFCLADIFPFCEPLLSAFDDSDAVIAAIDISNSSRMGADRFEVFEGNRVIHRLERTQEGWRAATN